MCVCVGVLCSALALCVLTNLASLVEEERADCFTLNLVAPVFVLCPFFMVPRFPGHTHLLCSTFRRALAAVLDLTNLSSFKTFTPICFSKPFCICRKYIRIPVTVI